MVSFLPPVKGAAWEFGISLFQRANTQLIQNPATLATGDVKLSKDGGAFANVTSLPGVVDGQVIVSLTGTETNADRLYIIFADQAGAEWTDLAFNVYTTARLFSSLAFPATAGQTVQSDVWNAVAASYVIPGTMGAAVAAASDPWATPLPGSYNVGQAGYIIGTFLDDSVSSRLPTVNIALDASGRVDVGLLVGSTAAANSLAIAANALGSGTVGNGSTTTSVVANTTAPSTTVADQFAGRLLTFTSDTGTINLRGVMRTISSNTAGSIFTVSALPVAPSSGDEFVIT